MKLIIQLAALVLLSGLIVGAWPLVLFWWLAPKWKTPPKYDRLRELWLEGRRRDQARARRRPILVITSARRADQ